MDFNADPSNIEETGQEEGTCFLDDWFERAPQLEVNEDIVGLCSYNKTLIVFFTDEELEDDDD